MADKKITELTNITGANLADADEFVVVDSSASETKAITWAELKSGLDTSTGFVRVTGDTMTGNLTFGDNNKAIFGAGSDLQIYHNGANSFISNTTGTFIIQDEDGPVYIRGKVNENSIIANADGAVELYHNNALRLATTSTGVDVTGTVTADGLTVDGNPVINNESPQLFFQTGSTHYNWQIAAQESANAAFEIASGSQDADATNDTYTKRLLVEQTGDISFYEDTGTTPKFFWDASAESLLLGTDSGDAFNAASLLRIQGTPDVYGSIKSATTGIAGWTMGDTDDDVTAGIFYNNASDYLYLLSNNAERLRIDSAGRVGIGTSSPDGNLTVGSTTTSGDISIRIKGDATSRGFLMFGDAGGAQLGDIMYDHSTDHMRFRVNNAERMRLSATGSLLLGTATGVSNNRLVIEQASGDGANSGFYLQRNGAAGQSFKIDIDSSDVVNFRRSTVQAMAITSSGRVGINTTTPVSELEVAGTITADAYDLDAISQVKAVTAVDVFVYDTSKDSDGGAWRKRTQHTSWYNEPLNTATRGSRREFPAVAVIVAEAAKVTIYDGDDPSLPMWMVFNGNGNYAFRSDATAISALNGVICVSTSAGKALQVFKFIADYTYLQSVPQYERGYTRIVDRNVAGTWVSVGGASIVDTNVNDVAMTVLPDAPIDPATGLPVPTIAVATDGGVSVIKDDGTVVDVVHTDNAGTLNVWLRGDLLIYNANQYLHARAIPSSDVSAGVRYVKNAADIWFAPRFASASYTGPSFHLHPTGAGATEVLQEGSNVSIANTDRLNRAIVSDTYDGLSALYNFTTSTYNTGWMNGDIKGAFLSSTDATSLVGSGELVTNGTFDTDTDWTKGTGWTISGGVASSDGSQTATSDLSQVLGISVAVGNRFAVTYTVSAYSAGTVRSVFGNDSGSTVTANGTYTDYYTVTTTSNNFKIRASLDFVGSVDNVSVKLADADRSVNSKGLIVNGTITRSAVATGAELVAYSGFSASNYLEQPYNPALDFGTGDFCVMGWFKLNGLVTDVLVSRKRVTPNRFIIQTAAGALQYLSSSVSLTTSQTFGDNTFRHFAVVRNNGTTTVYVNGVALLSGADAGDVNSGNPLFVGINEDLGAALAGSLALFRISATAPTAEAIKKIYNDEKVLFQANAAATLYGASDAVTALAHDSDTGLLHVGTSAGRSVFQGLRRVSNTTTAVGTAISASNSLVVEE